MPYTQLFYHFVWATKNREPRITPDIEPILYGYIRSKAIGLGGDVFAINGDPTHVHVASTAPSKIAVAQFVGQMKGVSSAKLNTEINPDPPFYWQADYGAFSVDGKRLRNVIAYVENQKIHHAQGTTIPILERTDDGKIRVLRENKTMYFVEEEQWRLEMLALSDE